MSQFEFCGELALSGDTRPIIGEIPTAYACKQDERICILPKANAPHAVLIRDAAIIGIGSLLTAFHHVHGLQTKCLSSS